MNFKYVKYLAAAMLAVSMTACDDDDDYAPGPMVDGFFFGTQPTEYVDLTLDDSSFSFKLSRNTTAGSATAQLTVVADPVFHFPQSVSFADGQSTVEVPVTFTAADLDLKDYYITVSVPADEAFPYGVTDLSLTVGLSDDLRWTSIGTGLYTDYYLGPFGVAPEGWEVEVQKHAVTPGLYRVLDAYYPYGGVGNVVINCEDPQGAYIEQQNIDMSAAGLGTIGVYSYAAYYLDRGNSLSAIKNAGYCGTLEDGIISFPQSTLLLVYGGSIYYANSTSVGNVLMLPEAYEASQTPSDTPAE